MQMCFFDTDMDINAQQHCDKQLIKLILEATQIASTVQHILDGPYAPYKKTHTNHPLVVWAAKSKANYETVCDYGLALCWEYTYRYGKRHKCEAYLENLYLYLPTFAETALTPYPKVTKEFDSDDIQQNYRQFFNKYKQHIATWSKRPTPDWYEAAHV